MRLSSGRMRCRRFRLGVVWMVRRVWVSPFGEHVKVGFALLALWLVIVVFVWAITPVGVVR
ncbi:hypothetical protein 7S3_39 [uncultured Caudovirales phage]|uniref:Uncharacterized protein n=1 Tax=uncultured Caudovirales phage TaxID=2100421 RepID=A0A2H4J7A1_9CAUD|nr:hypothetical protein 7S3_39 [uncultured Caudovirales phage]